MGVISLYLGMTIKDAFDELLNKNWLKQEASYIKKYKPYKSRFLNKSGKQKKKISEEKKIEMLRAAGYTVEVNIVVKRPKKKS